MIARQADFYESISRSLEHFLTLAMTPWTRDPQAFHGKTERLAQYGQIDL
jgi:hypothetical protein